MIRDYGVKGEQGSAGTIKTVDENVSVGICLPPLKEQWIQFEASIPVVTRVFGVSYEYYKYLYDVEVEKEEAYEQSLQQGFKGDFPKFMHTVRDSNGVDGWLGIIYKQQYNSLLNEEVYKGTYEEFLVFKEHCAWIKRSPSVCPNSFEPLAFTSAQPDERELKEQYEECVKVYYRGAFENFRKFTSNYCLSYCGAKGI